MAVIAQRTTVGTAATALWTEPAGAGADAKRRSVTVQNTSAGTVYVGGADVTPQRTLPAVTSVASTDIFTSTGHGLSVNQPVIFTALTGGAGLVTNTVYLVATVPDANTFTIKTIAGAAVDHTTNITSATTVTGRYGYAVPITTGLLQFEVDRGDMAYGCVTSSTQTVNVIVTDI